MASRLEFKLFRYIWQSEAGIVFGTNEREIAEQADDENQVIDVAKGRLLGSGEDITEADLPEEEEEEDE